VVSAIEHKSVLRAAEALREQGLELTVVGPRPGGAVAAEDVAQALRDDTILVALMLANNETGVLQPAREVAALCRAHGVRYHCDVVAAVGKLPLDLHELGADLASVSGHKLYAPKGCGVLYRRRGVPLEPLIHGCGQQDGLRSGTENTAGAVALGRACERLQEGAFRAVESPRLRDELWRGIRELAPEARRHGEGAALPNTLSVAFPGRSAAWLQGELGRRGVSCTAGAAGSSECAGAPSHVLTAMGIPADLARATLRFTLGATTRPEDVELALQALAGALSARAASRASAVP
jgi:cysteine desulfurase